MQGKARASRKLFVNDVLLLIGLDASEKRSKELFAVNMHITATHSFRTHTQALDTNCVITFLLKKIDYWPYCKIGLMWVIRLCFSLLNFFSLTLSRVFRTERVVHCTDCEAPWSKWWFVIMCCINNISLDLTWMQNISLLVNLSINQYCSFCQKSLT